MAADLPFSVQDIPGKGRGLVANRFIKLSSRILDEEPYLKLLTMSSSENDEISTAAVTDEVSKNNLYKQVRALSIEQREDFLSYRDRRMSYLNNRELYWHIIRVQFLSIDGKDYEGGMFTYACKINHSCDPNAVDFWNSKTGTNTVHARRDIEEGEEITISYLDEISRFDDRQKHLQEIYDFQCGCRLCALPTKERLRYDALLQRIDKLDNFIEFQIKANVEPTTKLKGKIPITLDKWLQWIYQLSKYCEKFDPEKEIAFRILHRAYEACMGGNDIARADTFLRAYRSYVRLRRGEDCKEFEQLDSNVKDLTKPTQLGPIWQALASAKPEDLDDPVEFECWLWPRGTPQVEGHPANFRNNVYFPTYRELPQKNAAVLKNSFGIDPEFYDIINLAARRPRKHWCYLGEIINSDKKDLLRVRDKLGEDITIMFDRQNCKEGLKTITATVGHTIAILYPEQHYHTKFHACISVKDLKGVMIFPASLKNLFKLSDAKRTYGVPIEGLQLCHGCGKRLKSDKLEYCPKCLCSTYCDETCLLHAKKYHKEQCRLFRIRDLREMFLLDWAVFEHRITFPLRSERMRPLGADETSEAVSGLRISGN